jgi:predicted P-loop ATPase
LSVTVEHDELRRLPEAMKALPQWLVWRSEEYEGDKKPRKVPYYVTGAKRRGGQGDAEDRARLCSFERAMEALKSDRWTGLGFAFLPGDGLIGIDIDGAIDPETGEIKQHLADIIARCASYTERSPSGRGVHIIVAGECKTFKDNRIGVEVFCGSQFFTCTGDRWDGTPESVEPISPETLEGLRTLVRGSRQQAAPAQLPTDPTTELRGRMEDALRYISPEGYHDWIHVGMAIKAALGDMGFRLWDYWSSTGSKYPGQGDLAKKWATFDGNGVGEGSLFHLAKQGGWQPKKTVQSGKPVERRSAQPGDGVGAPPPPDFYSSKNRKIRFQDLPAALQATLITATVKSGKKDEDGKDIFEQKIIDCRENVYECLRVHPELTGLVAFNEFAHRAVKTRTPPWKSNDGEWTDQDDLQLGNWLARQCGVMIKSTRTLTDGVAMAAFANSFHPVLDYLRALPAWDGIERLPFWLSECAGAEESTYTRLVGPWFIMNLVRRVQHPGCQADYMVVLEGAQGKRKSTLLRTLVGNDDWFADTPMKIGDKDALLSLAGKWLYEFGELDSFGKAEATTVKQYLTSRIDRVREPFGRRHVDRPRSCCFAGTTNQGEYVKDSTGARRFWPVECRNEINIDKLAQWRDQLFAEAMVRLASPDEEKRRCWPTRAEEELYLEEQQEQRQIGDPWFDLIARWLESDDYIKVKTKSEKGSVVEIDRRVIAVDEIDVSTILKDCLNVPVDRIDGSRQMSTRVGIIMHKLKWGKRRASVGDGSRTYVYVRPERQSSATKTVPHVPGGPGEELVDDF